MNIIYYNIMIYDYIIIGSGISGLYLGYLLKNKKYLILEKNDNIGGRIQQTNFHGSTIQLGAGVVKSNNVNMINLMKELKLKYFSFNKSVDRLIPNYDKDEYNQIIQKLKDIKNPKPQSMKETLKDIFKNDTKKINYFIKSF
jgi:protoporphyrinogen oxidase